jgi:hypothetical protein
MRRPHLAAPLPRLTLLPFLDLVLAFVGILLVIFALQAPDRPQSGRPLVIDDLLVCQAAGRVSLHTGPEAAPVIYDERDFDALLARLADQDGETRNLVFALTGDCFATQRAFEHAFSRWSSRLDAPGAPRRTFRLAFQPLSTAPEALPNLLAAWREHGH